MKKDECILYITETDRDDYEAVYDKYGKLFETSRIERIEKCRNSKAKRDLILTGTLLYRVLKDNGIKSESILLSPMGKPYIKGKKNFFFNTSHSGKYIVIATCGQEIGVDVQKPVTYRENVVRKIMSEAERERYSSDIATRFNYIWSLKESFSKLIGDGICMDYTKITYEESGDRVSFNNAGEYAAYGIARTLPGDYALTVCARNSFNIESVINVSF